MGHGGHRSNGKRGGVATERKDAFARWTADAGPGDSTPRRTVATRSLTPPDEKAGLGAG